MRRCYATIRASQIILLEYSKKSGLWGASFAIATTRSRTYAKELIETLQPDAMAVSGGALAYVGEQAVHCKPLSQEVVTQLLSLVQKLRANFTIDSSDGRFDQSQLEHVSPKASIYQILLSHSTNPDSLLTVFGSSVTVTPLWREDLFRLAHPEATKLAALQSITASMDPESVIAFGDDPMDLPMLSYYQGVAVANAQIAVRQAARHNTLSNQEDGVAHWLNQHLLQS